MHANKEKKGENKYHDEKWRIENSFQYIYVFYFCGVWMNTELIASTRDNFCHFWDLQTNRLAFPLDSSSFSYSTQRH